MSSVVKDFFKVLNSVSNAYMGRYSINDVSADEVREIRSEMMDLDVDSSLGRDKKSLRDDFNTVLKDTKKAQKEAAETCYG